MVCIVWFYKEVGNCCGFPSFLIQHNSMIIFHHKLEDKVAFTIVAFTIVAFTIVSILFNTNTDICHELASFDIFVLKC